MRTVIFSRSGAVFFTAFTIGALSTIASQFLISRSQSAVMVLMAIGVIAVIIAVGAYAFGLRRFFKDLRR